MTAHVCFGNGKSQNDITLSELPLPVVSVRDSLLPHRTLESNVQLNLLIEYIAYGEGEGPLFPCKRWAWHLNLSSVLCCQVFAELTTPPNYVKNGESSSDNSQRDARDSNGGQGITRRNDSGLLDGNEDHLYKSHKEIRRHNYRWSQQSWLHNRGGVASV